MKGKVKYLFLSLIGILVISLVVLSGCAGNDSAVLTFPAFEAPLPPPVEVTVDQLYQEYMADETAADAKYKGERLLLNEVAVEEVVSQTFISGGSSSTLNLYFMNGLVRFKLRDLRIMQNIEAGYVLNIVGECMGLQKVYAMAKEYVIYVGIEDCWVESVIGDIGSGGELDMDVY